MTANSGKNVLRKVMIFVISLFGSIYLGWLLSHWGIILGIVAGVLLFVAGMYVGLKNPNSFFEKW